LGESDFQDKNETVKDFRHYIFAIINRTRNSPILFQKSKWKEITRIMRRAAPRRIEESSVIS